MKQTQIKYKQRRHCLIKQYFDFISKMSLNQQQGQRMVEGVAVIDIDPSLSLYRPTQQKWISSLELHQQLPKDIKSNSKSLMLSQGLFLVVNFCQKNRLPIYEIDFLSQPTPDWMSIKMPCNFTDKYGLLFLCYRAEQLEFYEPLTDIEILTERKNAEDKQVFTVPAGYKIINNNPITHSYIIYKRMRSILQQTFKSVLLERYPQENKKINLALLPLFCFPQGVHLSKELKGFITFNFIFTNENGDRIYVTCLSFKECLQESYCNKLNLKSYDKVYYEKAFCVLSKYRYTDEFSECLQHMYRLSMSKNDVPFYKVAQSFAANMILPKQIGINGISYSYGGSNICFNTNINYPTASQKALFCLFKFLEIHSIINIFEAILLQKKIFFVSQSKTILGYAVQAFLSLIYPFKWQHVLIPILPLTLRQYLTAPVPLIAGIHPLLADNTIESDSLIVNLDTGEVMNDQDLPPLPQKLEKQMKKRLEMFQYYNEIEVKQYLQNPENTYIFKMQEIEHPEFSGSIIRDIFFEFMLTLMRNYKKYWKTTKYKELKETSSMSFTEPQLINDIFKVQDFLSDLGMTKVGSFGYKFTQGQLFTAFIERRHQYPHDPQIHFFDEAIQKKKSKKEVQFFQSIKNQKYFVAKHPQPQQVKSSFSYERFPSILNRKIIKQEDIGIEIRDENSENQENQQLIEFINEQYIINRSFFQKSSSIQQIDHRIESLLLNTHKKQYLQIKQEKIKEEKQKQKIEETNLSKSKLIIKEKSKKIELQFFQHIYLRQIDEIQNIFTKWPSNYTIKANFQQIDRQIYYRGFLKHKFDNIPNEDMIGVYQNIGKSKNFKILIKGNCKILLVDGEDEGFLTENLRGSRKKINIQIRIPHNKIRAFVNEIIPQQPGDIFAFMFEQAHKGCSWNIETLIQLKTKLQNSQNNN